MSLKGAIAALAGEARIFGRLPASERFTVANLFRLVEIASQLSPDCITAIDTNRLAGNEVGCGPR